MPEPESGPVRNAFAQRILDLRRGASLTQRQLAQLLGIDFTYLSKLENGRGDPPSEETIKRLAAAVNGDADELLALAGKISVQLRERAAGEKDFAMLLRKLPELPDDVLRRMYRQAGIEPSSEPEADDIHT